MLVSLNAWGAHGAVIPDDAPHVERYAYQFYVGPDVDSLNALIETLPPERRLRWRTKAEVLQDGRAEALR
jgi:hypothetical protein